MLEQFSLYLNEALAAGTLWTRFSVLICEPATSEERSRTHPSNHRRAPGASTWGGLKSAGGKWSERIRGSSEISVLRLLGPHLHGVLTVFSQTAFQSCLDHVHTVFGSSCLPLDRVWAIFRSRLGRFWIVCSLLGDSRGFSASVLVARTMVGLL